MTSIDLLEFSFKYTAIIALSHFFISRSGDIVAKKERQKLKTLFKIEMIGASFILFSILVLEIYTYIDASDESEKSEMEAILFHLCHDWETLISYSFWWLSNVLLLFIGMRISRAILNQNLHYMTLE